MVVKSEILLQFGIFHIAFQRIFRVQYFIKFIFHAHMLNQCNFFPFFFVRTRASFGYSWDNNSLEPSPVFQYFKITSLTQFGFYFVKKKIFIQKHGFFFNPILVNFTTKIQNSSNVTVSRRRRIRRWRGLKLLSVTKANDKITRFLIPQRDFYFSRKLFTESEKRFSKWAFLFHGESLM